MMKRARCSLMRSSPEAATCRAGGPPPPTSSHAYNCSFYCHSTVCKPLSNGTLIVWMCARCRGARGAIVPGSLLVNLSQQQPATCAPGMGPKLLRRSAAPQDVPGEPPCSTDMGLVLRPRSKRCPWL